MKIPVVRLWPVISIVLCSCAAQAPSPPPVVLAPAHCPAPAVPLLPQLDPAAPLEGDANLEALLPGCRHAPLHRRSAGGPGLLGGPDRQRRDAWKP